MALLAYLGMNAHKLFPHPQAGFHLPHISSYVLRRDGQIGITDFYDYYYYYYYHPS
jgi:hypothetical protein